MKRPQAQTPQVRDLIQFRRLDENICVFTDDEQDQDSSHEATKLVRVKYNPLANSKEGKKKAEPQLILPADSPLDENLPKQNSQEESSLCIHGIIEQQQNNHAVQGTSGDQDKLQLNDRQDEVNHNTFLETITNLEAFDIKLREASEDNLHDSRQRSRTQNNRRKLGVTQNKDTLQLTNQTMSIENSAHFLKE